MTILPDGLHMSYHLGPYTEHMQPIQEHWHTDITYPTYDTAAAEIIYTRSHLSSPFSYLIGKQKKSTLSQSFILSMRSELLINAHKKE